VPNNDDNFGNNNDNLPIAVSVMFVTLIIFIIYRKLGKSLCTRLQCIVIAHARLMN